jgi:quercetin dioxygenase-like cupin family protein
MVNLFVQMPYEQEGMSKRFLVDKDHLKLIQVGLKPGQVVPQHTTRGDVYILALQGKVVINLEGVHAVAHEGSHPCGVQYLDDCPEHITGGCPS